MATNLEPIKTKSIGSSEDDTVSRPRFEKAL